MRDRTSNRGGAGSSWPLRRCESLDARLPSWGGRDEVRRARSEGEGDSPKRLVESSRAAVQRAHKAFQATAANCQNNLRSLGSNLMSHPAVENAQRQLEAASSRLSQSWGEALGQNSGKGVNGGGRLRWPPVNGHQAGFQSGFQQLGDVLQQSFPWERVQQAASRTGDKLKEKGEADFAALRNNLRRHLGVVAEEAVLREIEAQPQKQDQRQKWKGTCNLREPGRRVAIVTTASLPWLTGTAVNPLLRAAYLARDSSRKVTLVVPWLSKTDQAKIFPQGQMFESPEDQEKYIRDWAQERTGIESKFKITFYPGRYAQEKCSVLPVGDVTSYVPDHEADVAILEEPEHLNWYHHGQRWNKKFNHVVGIMHTNYVDYARREENGDIKARILHRVNQWVTRIHCDQVVKLSDAVQPLIREKTMFVHGVSPTFIRVGKNKALQAQSVTEPGASVFPKGMYFIGKMVWGKGYTELLDLLANHSNRRGQNLHVDVYGSGIDSSAVMEKARESRLDVDFHAGRDHADPLLQDYKVFVNPSLSDVVATTTAEALAMGKFVVCADHPANKFFSQFPNCLIYRTPEEFSQQVEKALSHNPEPLSEEDQRKLTWEAATERLMDVTEMSKDETAGGVEALVDNFFWAAHNSLTRVEPLRVVAGAGANTRDNPQRVEDFVPSESEAGGFLDSKKRVKQVQR
ncbi:unnamed protein product [Ostreobium quekettii]|uniref:Digalactosyldiacylglycerol synthase n=1 Tax=Ostreobium quekettii TaxID=121088 RepID=A0A8S1IW81_9CHLO|nr:unnamed protein product [Ostreobium quekettii]|eukprot:evm.model.scf_770.5 EVM.evm.TU.scf_770.5   scf_770:28891-31932(-)